MPNRPSATSVWFRNDLRLEDHAALSAAVATGLPVAPIYVLDDAAAGPWRLGGAARWWLHHSLTALQTGLEALGAGLILRRGSAADILPALAREIGATEVFTGGSAEPWARQLDRLVAQRLEDAGSRMRRMRTTTLFAPDAIRTRAGGPYGVFTPFARACLEHRPGPPPPLPIPERFSCPAAIESDRLADWGLLPTAPDWAQAFPNHWTPGEAAARTRLQAFLDTGVTDYAAARDRLDLPATSGLSPHLRFGEISPARIWHAARALPVGNGRDTFVKELLWREFSHHLLWSNPDIPELPLRPSFAQMPWRRDESALRAWQRGQTGIPVVDAAIRQLWQTGWMHNRARMIVASLLTKHLLIPWQDGEAWFWDTLLDADLASNAASWQWVAGSGADAAPFFRIFNPVTQGKKFDPDGAYVRRFVPELAHLDTADIHAPWELPAHRRPRGYPAPIVDLATGRARALAAYAAVKDGTGAESPPPD